MILSAKREHGLDTPKAFPKESSEALPEQVVLPMKQR
jgi:hypothetical protein